jgi:hypothetical protein
MPTMTAIARRPAIRGVENPEYCDKNAIIEPELAILFKDVPPKLRTVKYNMDRDKDAAKRGDR